MNWRASHSKSSQNSSAVHCNVRVYIYIYICSMNIVWPLWLALHVDLSTFHSLRSNVQTEKKIQTTHNQTHLLKYMTQIRIRISTASAIHCMNNKQNQTINRTKTLYKLFLHEFIHKSPYWNLAIVKMWGFGKRVPFISCQWKLWFLRNVLIPFLSCVLHSPSHSLSFSLPSLLISHILSLTLSIDIFFSSSSEIVWECVVA